MEPKVPNHNRAPAITIMTVATVWKLAVALTAVATTFLPTLADVDAVPQDFQRDRYFTPGFIFGVSASAHQTEGAPYAKRKGKSIWDHFSETYPERAGGGAQEGIDFYSRYEEDIKLMKEVGINAFRLSISWPRLLPHGRRAKGVNPDGVIFYNNVIDKLLEHNIEPCVTIYHWDVPYALEEEYGGFLSKRIVEDFKNFAQLCFELFGDRVKRWMTINEPWTLSVLGYGLGMHAPGRCSCSTVLNAKLCNKKPGPDGDAGTEPYIVSHNMLLAHAAAVQEYRRNFKEFQMGEIGLSLCSNWFLHKDESEVAINAVKYSLDWSYGWHLSPVTYGKYPDSMIKSLGKRLPEFTEDEKYQLIKSFDFIGVNYYGSAYAVHTPELYNPDCPSISYDYNVTWMNQLPGPYKNPAGLGEYWNGMFATYPEGLRELLKYTMAQYENPTIYITENGVSDDNPASSHFHKDHIWQMRKAITEDWVNVKGYFIWSFMDSYEWSSGYRPKMGIVHVDRDKNLTRTIKSTGQWYQSFLLGKVTPTPIQPHGGEL